MRKLVLAGAAALGVLATTAIATRSEAMPLDPVLRPAAQALNPVEKTACWRVGRFGWGWYGCRPHFWGPHVYWGPRVYWAPRPLWYRHFAWRRWHHWY